MAAPFTFMPPPHAACGTTDFTGHLGLAPAAFLVGCLFTGSTWHPRLRPCNFDRPLRPYTTDTHLAPVTSLYALVLAWTPSTACALLDFAGAPAHIKNLRVLHSVDIDINTITSPALDIALCLSSWLAAISAQMLMLVSTTVIPEHDGHQVSADRRLL